MTSSVFDPSPITTHLLVRAEHLNAAGHLFGGYLMGEIDTVAYCLLRTRYPSCAFVTRAARIEFVSPAPLGSVVRFDAVRGRVGRTSVEVEVTGGVDGREVARATMTFVRVVDGRSAPVPCDAATACEAAPESIDPLPSGTPAP